MQTKTLEDRLSMSAVKASFSHEAVIKELKIVAEMLSDGRLFMADDKRNEKHLFKRADCTLWAAYLLRAASVLELLTHKE